MGKPEPVEVGVPGSLASSSLSIGSELPHISCPIAASAGSSAFGNTFVSFVGELGELGVSSSGFPEGTPLFASAASSLAFTLALCRLHQDHQISKNAIIATEKPTPTAMPMISPVPRCFEDDELFGVPMVVFVEFARLGDKMGTI